MFLPVYKETIGIRYETLKRGRFSGNLFAHCIQQASPATAKEEPEQLHHVVELQVPASAHGGNRSQGYRLPLDAGDVARIVEKVSRWHEKELPCAPTQSKCTKMHKVSSFVVQ